MTTNSTDNENISMTAMRERLKVLRSQCGIDNAESSNNNPNSQQSGGDAPKEPLVSISCVIVNIHISCFEIEYLQEGKKKKKNHL